MLQEIRKELSKGYTENGDISYSSTMNMNLDFFGKSGSLRNDPDEAIKLFFKAYEEENLLALKNLLYLRDIRDGYGERDLFREILLNLTNTFDDNVNIYRVIDAIPELGRYDDMIYLLNSKNKKVKKHVMNNINKQLKEDLIHLKNDEPISLLAKWMPSINTSSKETVNLARYICKHTFNGNERSYRKALSVLRERLNIIERYLTNKDYTFDYNKIPAIAMSKYTEAFRRNDEERYADFKRSLLADPSKFQKKADNMMPYELIGLVSKDCELADSLWAALDNTPTDTNTLVVRDGSGSMYRQGEYVIETADALSIYMSERINGPMKNKFITFSSRPQLVELPDGASLSEKLRHLRRYNDVSNTDIMATYNLIYEVTRNLKPEDQIDNVIIVSDMQFDHATTEYADEHKSTFEHLKEKFNKAGMKLPKMVYWNVADNRNVFTTQETEYIQLVSGLSKNVFRTLSENVELRAEDLMLEALSKYDCIFE